MSESPVLLACTECAWKGNASEHVNHAREADHRLFRVARETEACWPVPGLHESRCACVECAFEGTWPEGWMDHKEPTGHRAAILTCYTGSRTWASNREYRDEHFGGEWPELLVRANPHPRARGQIDADRATDPAFVAEFDRLRAAER